MNRYIWLFLILCFTIANSIILGSAYAYMQYIATLLLFIMMISKSPVKIYYSSLAYLAACLLSIFVNDIPSFFSPYSKIVFLSIAVMVFSPLFSGNYEFAIQKLKMLETLLVSMFIITISSFFFRLAGGGYTNVGYFGYALHPNFLGFFAMFSALSFFSLFFLTDKLKYKIFVGTLFLCSVFVLMISAARICLAGTALGCLVFTYLRYKERFTKFLTITSVVVGLLIVTFPLYESSLEGIFYKQNAAKQEGSATSDRDLLWKTRLYEYENNPLFGVGCFSVDVSLKNNPKYFQPFSEVTGSVELGSTYLGVMSQTGTVGIVCFLIILLIAFYKCYKSYMNSDSIVPVWLLSLFSALLLHMVVEGYANNPGSLQCLILWGLLGCMCIDVDYMENYETLLVETLELNDSSYEDDGDDVEIIE